MPFRIARVEAFTGNQVILWLADEHSGQTSTVEGSEWCVRLRADSIHPLIADLLEAYGRTMAKVMLEVAAGGCRTCGNTRLVDVNHLADLMAGGGGGKPCPVCVPRAEERIRKAAHLPRERA